jgi:hypothetical protein
MALPSHHQLLICSSCHQRVLRCRCGNSSTVASGSDWTSAAKRAIVVHAYDDHMIAERTEELLEKLREAGHADAAAMLTHHNRGGRLIDRILQGEVEPAGGRALPRRAQSKNGTASRVA